MNTNSEQNDLIELIKIALEKKLTIFVITVVTCILAVIFALYKSNTYKSTAVVSPVQQQQGALSGLASQFGGLASLAGVNLNQGQSSSANVAMEYLKSRSIFIEFVDEYDLKPEIMAAKGWSQKDDKISYDEDLFDPKAREWKIDSGGKTMEPLNFDMHLKFIEDMLSISKNAETGFVNITIEHYSPVFAKDMVENLVDFINRKVKEREVSNANLRIRYLENAMEKTQQANMHSVFFNLIEQQHHKKMLALTTDEVALAIIDKPIIAEKKSNPQRALICFLGGLLGGIISLVYMVTVLLYRKVKSSL